LRGGIGALHESTATPAVNLDFPGLYIVLKAYNYVPQRQMKLLERINQNFQDSDREFLNANIFLKEKSIGWPEHATRTLQQEALFSALSFMKTVTKDRDAYA
jgi:hypothetical protein